MNREREKYFFWLKILVTIAVLTLCVIRFDWICIALKEMYGIVFPFLLGGIIAFILNIPMVKIETLLFSKANGKFMKAIKRPVSIVLTIIILFLVFSILIFTVVPQFVETVSGLPEQIKDFYYSTLAMILELMNKYPEITESLMLEIRKIMEIEIDWKQVVSTVTDFFMNGIGGSFIKNTFSVAGKIGGGIVNAVISIVFSIYLLVQKEKLISQAKRVMSAFLSEAVYVRTMRVLTLLSNNFSNFIAGQCVEAVILGLLIMIPMLILGFDYALLIGVLVGFTSLVPVVGAFVGCGVGAFLFLLQDPLTALWFVILFLIVQQIEGNLIYPYVVGNSVGLPALWILAAITVGGSLFGIAGMLFFIPLFSTAYILLRDTANSRNAQKDWAQQAWETNYLPRSVLETQRRREGNAFFALRRFGINRTGISRRTGRMQQEHQNERQSTSREQEVRQSVTPEVQRTDTQPERTASNVNVGAGENRNRNRSGKRNGNRRR